MIAVYITKANGLDDFIYRTLLFVCAGPAWSLVDLVRYGLAKLWEDPNEKPGKMVGLWIVLDFLLLVIAYLIRSQVGDELTRAVIVAGVYVLFLLLDLLAIVRGVQVGS
jgi:hypothetical protein